MLAILIRKLISPRQCSPFLDEINRNGERNGRLRIRRGIKLNFHANFSLCFTKSAETASMRVNNIFLGE